MGGHMKGARPGPMPSGKSTPKPYTNGPALPKTSRCTG